MYARSLLAGPLAALLLAGCSQAPPAIPDTRDADLKALKDTETAWNKDIKDIDKSTSYYAEDATLLMPNQPVVNGRAGIKETFKQFAGDPNFDLHFESVKADVSKSGEIGYTQGTYTMTMTDPATKKPMTDRGKYLTVYKKQADGSWKAAQDMINSDTPLPPPHK